MNVQQGRIQDFFRRGCTRRLLYFNTNKPHSFFFGRIPVVLENCRSSQGGGGGVRTPCTLPLDPPLYSYTTYIIKREERQISAGEYIKQPTVTRLWHCAFDFKKNSKCFVRLHLFQSIFGVYILEFEICLYGKRILLVKSYYLLSKDIDRKRMQLTFSGKENFTGSLLKKRQAFF